MAFEVSVRKWGNSFGIILPREFMKKNHITPNQKVLVDVVKEADLRKTFGTLKTNISGQEFKDMVKQGWK
jgi:antitoxin MazE